MIDERTELLINRKLDGELNEAESLELNKSLIRSPEARAMLEEYTRTDGLAVAALKEVFPDSTVAVHAPSEIEAWTSTGRRWQQRSLRGFGVGIAAMIAAMIGGLPGNRLGWVNPPSGEQKTTGIAAEAGIVPFDSAVLAPLIEGPRSENERIRRNVIAVYDEATQQIYLLEIDQIGTTAASLQENY